ncbi:MAG: ABC transporter permease [Deltaproteobacteria bacterium]|nr:ABC transporter permease [Deltaproteobacteria bacterium]MBK8239971.1 ABC transporter permease [Deltaproteobacteria bacterium]MBK8716042.1 ABC transporter permease [Deltaproteobacteria bacterium]MBP7286884.1 ABC transporter permease [Nannocystaceae bacterium]
MMRMTDALAASLETLSGHKLRSALTMLGMMFGVGAVIAMLSIGAGAQRRALGLIERMGVRNVLVRAKSLEKDELVEIRKKSTGLSLRDVDAIEEAVPQIDLAAPRVEIDAYKILSHTGKTEAKVYGVTPAHAHLTALTLAQGRMLDAIDERTHAQVCLLGSATRRELFGAAEALGQAVKVNDVWLEVVGVLAPEGDDDERIEGVAVASRAREILVPLSTAQRKFDHDPLEDPLAEITVRTLPDADPLAVAAVVAGLVERLHGGADDFEVVVPQQLLEQSRETQRLFDLVMGCIAGISLLVGGIGIMNIMLASVLEQTRAIGIRRAVGARRRDIGLQFLLTAFSLSLLGGAAGVGLGIGIADVVAAWADWPTVVTASTIVLSTGVSLAVGLVSGLYPALRAARLQPIEALRHE